VGAGPGAAGVFQRRSGLRTSVRLGSWGLGHDTTHRPSRSSRRARPQRPARRLSSRVPDCVRGTRLPRRNSLGRPPTRVPPALAEIVHAGWSERLIRSWTEGWMDLALDLGERIGTLVDAATGQLVVADSTTVCFYKAASAALDARPGRTEIVTDAGNFPTDRYVLESLAASRGLRLRLLEPVDRTLGPSTADLSASRHRRPSPRPMCRSRARPRLRSLRSSAQSCAQPAQRRRPW
jgi:hypothetical protein